MKPVRVPFPWMSAAGAALILAWQFLLLHPRFVDGIGWAERLMREKYLAFGVAGLLLIVVFELRRYLRAIARNRQQMQRYRDQIDELFDAKRALGTRARTFSDHADKLKMFISERLLEYIEYDEKFLHFKNIASEVRHNGVISYDRAQTALQRAAEHCPPAEADACREAADSLLYLWDLLDLSTTDNIALYVTNRIYDCEEHYFQAQLNPDEAAAAPVQPTFRMGQALVRALSPIVENADGLAALRAGEGRYHDGQFSVVVQSDGELLGNVNHMVLLIENLVNNALFYAKQKAPRQAHNPVTIYLARVSGEVLLRVYNRGPHISEDEKDRIYQLGFSSRRIREHHGKGLGLYFVNEIRRGFEGRIGFDNIDNRTDELSLSVKLANGGLLRERIGIVDVAGKPMCQLPETGEQVARRHEWSYDSPIASIEVSSRAEGKPQVIADLAGSADSSYIDRADPQRAYWMLDITNRKRSSRLRFVPLDVRGVEFTLAFATASARLENQD